MMKKSPLATAVVAPSLKAASVSKFAALAAAAYLTIRETVAPASVLVKVVAAAPVACPVVRVIAPAVSEPKTAFGVPKVGVRPLMDAADKVATFEFTVMFTR